MLTIREAQFRDIESFWLQRLKEEIARHLATRYPREAQAFGAEGLLSFVREQMTAARSCYIDTAEHIDRFVGMVFEITHVDPAPGKTAAFMRAILTENSAEARLDFCREIIDAHSSSGISGRARDQ